MSTGAPQHRPFVLLTGATGLVGGLVLAELLACEIPVAVLVRGNRRQTAAERVEALMQRLEERFDRLFVRPVVLSGDLCTPGLGISDPERRWLAGNCGSVIHSAASLLFRPASEHPNNEPYRTNFEGTKYLLEVTTSAGILEWHYVSTAYIAGLRSGRILESESDVGQQFGNDYERSKTMVEHMLRNCRGCEQSQNPLTRPATAVTPFEGKPGQGECDNGIRSLTVYRPSIVIDLHPARHMKSDQTINASFAVFQALSQRFGMPKRGEWIQLLGLGGDERKNIVTVDWVARMMTQIYRRPALHDQTYHLTSPSGFSVSALEDALRTASEASGEQQPSPRREATASFDQQAAPFVAAFNPYFRDDPLFDRTNIVRAMEICGEPETPSLTIEQLRDFCLRPSKPAAMATATTSEKSAWIEFLEDRKADDSLILSTSRLFPRRGIEGPTESNPENSDSCTAMGLTLSGAGGGQWVVEDTEAGLRIHVAAASLLQVRWFATSRTLNQLIAGQVSISDAMESGLLMIEIDYAPGSPALSLPISQSTSCIALFSGLIAQIKRHHQRKRGQKSEVANVG